MNIEIINKIKSRMAGELLPDQLNKLVCDSKNQSCLQLFLLLLLLINMHLQLLS